VLKILLFSPWFACFYQLLDLIEKWLLDDSVALNKFVNDLCHFKPTLNQKISITMNLHLSEQTYRHSSNSETSSQAKIQQTEVSLATPNHDNAPFGYVRTILSVSLLTI
jgi:hypothetical protein